MFTFHIYLGDTCIGDTEAETPDSAVNLYAERTKTATNGLTAVLIMPKDHEFYPAYRLLGHNLFVEWISKGPVGQPMLVLL